MPDFNSSEVVARAYGINFFMKHFTLSEAAERYDKYRPKVHGIIKNWLSETTGKTSFENAIDMACGTGDSTQPLLELSKKVVGVDSSEEMIKFCAKKGINTLLSSYEDIEIADKFDLITTCMAFHWFEPELAVKKYKNLSANGAIWLIYNFVFMGSIENQDFNKWMIESYLKDYPSPPRGKYSNAIPVDPELKVLKQDKGYIGLNFDKSELIKYLTTQSNIEAIVKSGKSYKEIESELSKSMPDYPASQQFRYEYTYGIYEFSKSEQRKAAGTH